MNKYSISEEAKLDQSTFPGGKSNLWRDGMFPEGIHDDSGFFSAYLTSRLRLLGASRSAVGGQQQRGE